MSVTYVFQRGETISLFLDVERGDTSALTEIAVRLRRIMGGSQSADFVLTPRAAAGDVPQGWNLIISAEVSATLPPSIYEASVRLQVAGGVIEGDNPARVQIKPSAFAP